MLKIAICEDELVQLGNLSDLTKSIMDDYVLPFQVDTFTSGVELLKATEMGIVYDIVFLDIEMNGLNGIEAGAALRQQAHNLGTVLIYISAHENRAKEVFYNRAVRFLSKPVDIGLLKEALLYACNLIKEQKKGFSFKTPSGEKINLLLSDIIYFEITLSHRISVITSQSKYTFYGRMEEISEKLSKNEFLRIHKAYLINYEHIKEISYKEVILKNNMKFQISEARRKGVRKQFYEISFRRTHTCL